MHHRARRPTDRRTSYNGVRSFLPSVFCDGQQAVEGSKPGTTQTDNEKEQEFVQSAGTACEAWRGPRSGRAVKISTH